MAIYIIIALIILIFSRHKNRGIYICLSLFLILIATFRSSSVGTDTMTYEYIYENFIYNDWLKNPISYLNIEFFWGLIISVLHFFNCDFDVFKFTSSLLLFIAVSSTYYKDSPRPIFNLLLLYYLGFYFMSLNITRQVIAASFILVVIRYLFNGGKYYIAVISIFLISLVHTSALICLLLIPIHALYRKINMFTIIIILIGTFVFNLCFDYSGLFKNILDTIGLYDAYGGYLDVEFDAKFSLNRLAMVGLYVIIPLLDKKALDNYLYYVCAFGIVCLNLFNGIPWVNRLYIYFSICQVLYLPMFASKNINSRLIIYLYAIVVFIMFIMVNNGGMVPYKIEI